MTKFETFRFLSMDQQIKKRNFRYLNDPSAINITMCVCRTLHALSVEVFVAFIESFLLILCSLKKKLRPIMSGFLESLLLDALFYRQRSNKVEKKIDGIVSA